MPQQTTRIASGICITSSCSGTAFYNSEGVCVGVCSEQNEPCVVTGPVTLAKTFADSPALRVYTSHATTATDATDQLSRITASAMLAKLSPQVLTHLECAVLNLRVPLAKETLFWFYKLLAWRALEQGGSDEDAKNTAMWAMFQSKEAIAIHKFIGELQKLYAPKEPVLLEQMQLMCMAVGSLGPFDGSESAKTKALEKIVAAIAIRSA